MEEWKMTDQIAGLEKRQYTESKAILLRLLFTRSGSFCRPVYLVRHFPVVHFPSAPVRLHPVWPWTTSAHRLASVRLLLLAACFLRSLGSQ